MMKSKWKSIASFKNKLCWRDNLAAVDVPLISTVAGLCSDLTVRC